MVEGNNTKCIVESQSTIPYNHQEITMTNYSRASRRHSISNYSICVTAKNVANLNLLLFF